MRAQRAQRGQSLVEFAIVLPVFLLVLFGLIDFTRLLFTYISVVNGARELSRGYAISSRTNPGQDGINAFNALTIFGGTVKPATSVTLGTGAAACNALTSAGCSFSLAASTSSITLTAGSGAIGSLTVSLAPASISPSGLTLSANGDYVMVSAIDSSLSTGTLRICPLPLQTGCAPSLPTSSAAGFVQVDVTYTFNFNPLFQNRLEGVVDASFMRPVSVLTTSARSYLE
jgi:Flp pilus assembly protein TadG